MNAVSKLQFCMCAWLWRLQSEVVNSNSFLLMSGVVLCHSTASKKANPIWTLNVWKFHIPFQFKLFQNFKTFDIWKNRLVLIDRNRPNCIIHKNPGSNCIIAQQVYWPPSVGKWPPSPSPSSPLTYRPSASCVYPRSRLWPSAQGPAVTRQAATWPGCSSATATCWGAGARTTASPSSGGARTPPWSSCSVALRRPWCCSRWCAVSPSLGAGPRWPATVACRTRRCCRVSRTLTAQSRSTRRAIGGRMGRRRAETGMWTA